MPILRLIGSPLCNPPLKAPQLSYTGTFPLALQYYLRFILLDMIIELVVLTLWFFCLITGYRYFRHLFSDLKLEWNPSNRLCCALICLAGPAAILAGLAVDYSRPLAG